MGTSPGTLLFHLNNTIIHFKTALVIYNWFIPVHHPPKLIHVKPMKHAGVKTVVW